MTHGAPNREELIEWVTKKLSRDEHDRLREIILRWNSTQGTGVYEVLVHADAGPRGASPVEQLAQLRNALEQVVALAAGIGPACTDPQLRELCLRAATQCRVVSIHLQRQQLFAPSGT